MLSIIMYDYSAFVNILLSLFFVFYGNSSEGGRAPVFLHDLYFIL